MITKPLVDLAVGFSAVTEPQAQTNVASLQSDRINSFETITPSRNNPYNKTQPEGLPRNMNFDSEDEPGNESDDDNTVETLLLEDAILTKRFGQLDLNKDTATERELLIYQAFLSLRKHYSPILSTEAAAAAEDIKNEIGHHHNQDLQTRGPDPKKTFLPEKQSPISRTNYSVSRIHGNGGFIVQNSLTEPTETSTSFKNDIASCVCPSHTLNSDCFDVDSLPIDIEEVKRLTCNTTFCNSLYNALEADLHLLYFSPTSDDSSKASMEVKPSTSWAQTTPLPMPSPQGQHSPAPFYSASPITSPYGESSGYSSSGTMSPTGSEPDLESGDTVSKQVPQNCLAKPRQPPLKQLPQNCLTRPPVKQRTLTSLIPKPANAPNHTPNITPLGEALHPEPISAGERLSRIANSKDKNRFFIVELVKVIMSIKTVPNNEVEGFKRSLWEVMKNPQQRNFELAIFAHLEFLKAPFRVKSYKSVLSMKDENGHSLLFVAAVKHKQALIARYIAEVMNHVDPSLCKVNEKGNSILHDVALQGDSHQAVLLELLVASDKDKRIYNVNELNREGKTVLMAALSNAGHPYINTVMLLLQEKADPFIEDRSGLIALQYLVKLVSNHKLQQRTDKWPPEDRKLATKLLPIFLHTRNELNAWEKLCGDPSIPDFIRFHGRTNPQ